MVSRYHSLLSKDQCYQLGAKLNKYSSGSVLNSVLRVEY